jgi:alpha-tubulin suppressor-like RCC1 family protein
MALINQTIKALDGVTNLVKVSSDQNSLIFDLGAYHKEILLTESNYQSRVTLSTNSVDDIFKSPHSNGSFFARKGTILLAWGINSLGSLGIGSTNANLVSTPVPVLTTSLNQGEYFVSASAGPNHTLFLSNQGRAFSSGLGTSGELGLNISTQTTITTPTLISFPDLQGEEVISSISAGNNTSFALTSLGRVFAWGNNTTGQIGDGTTTSRNSPVLISFSGLQVGETITSIKAGGYYAHTLALTSLGRVFAWGNRVNGSLGDGLTSGQTTSPGLVTFSLLQQGETISSISLGLSNIALTSLGRVFTWGANTNGILGDGTTTLRSTPILISFSNLQQGETISSIYSGGNFSMALTNTGVIYSWGTNTNTQQGSSSVSNVLSPTRRNVTLPVGENFVKLTLGGISSAALTNQGNIYGSGVSSSVNWGDGAPSGVGGFYSSFTLIKLINSIGFFESLISSSDYSVDPSLLYPQNTLEVFRKINAITAVPNSVIETLLASDKTYIDLSNTILALTGSANIPGTQGSGGSGSSYIMEFGVAAARVSSNLSSPNTEATLVSYGPAATQIGVGSSVRDKVIVGEIDTSVTMVQDSLDAKIPKTTVIKSGDIGNDQYLELFLNWSEDSVEYPELKVEVTYFYDEEKKISLFQNPTVIEDDSETGFIAGPSTIFRRQNL